MADRAKQATLALNLLAIAMAGLLYRMGSVDDHIVHEQVNPEITMREPTTSKGETTPPLFDAGIKMVDVDLPPPSPTPAARMPSTESMTVTSKVPALKQSKVLPQSLQSKPSLKPMKVNIASPQSNHTLKKSLAKIETVATSPKRGVKLEILPVELRNVTAKTLDLRPLPPKKFPPQVSVSSNPQPVGVASLEALVKAKTGHQQIPSLQSAKKPSITPLIHESGGNALPTEIHIHQADLLRGQQILNKVAGEGSLDMEIFWPPTAQQSEYLYKVMTRCFGMQSAVIDKEGDLFFTSGKDRKSRIGFSPLLRKIMQPAGRDEVSVINKIVKRNAISDSYTPVRIFSKLVDARLIDGITQVTGKVIHSQSVLRANYAIDQGQVYITNITHDGILSSGRLLLANGGC